MTPSESYVYSKLGFDPLYDSFGVERIYERINFYKHSIPLGLGFQMCLYFEKSGNAFQVLLRIII